MQNVMILQCIYLHQNFPLRANGEVANSRSARSSLGGGVCESNCGNLPDAQKFKSLKITSLFSRWEHQAPDQWPKLEPQYDYFEA